MTERERAVRLALDLLRELGPLTTGDLLRCMPRHWHDRLTGNPGQWLTTQREWRGHARRDPATREWHAVLPTRAEFGLGTAATVGADEREPHEHAPEFSAAGCVCRGCRRPLVARYATAEEWAEVEALRDEVGALRVSCAVADSAVRQLTAALAEAEALAAAVRVWANEPYLPNEDAEEYIARVGQLREDAILDALREYDAATASGRGE
jgi:hypothetical protein